MRKTIFLGIVAAAGCAGAAALFPAAHGATAAAPLYRQLDLFEDALERVRQRYVQDVDDSELIGAAINGMVGSLDPHSSYMNAEEYAEMVSENRGEFAGIGIEMTLEDGALKVISPIDDTPASRAGLKTGDTILAIDGTSTQGMPLNEAVDRLRGRSNSEVMLTILKKGEKKPADITLVRALVRVQPVKYERKGDVAHIRITTFSQKTNVELVKAVQALKAEIGPGIRGYVLDLRNDPGGLLNEAISVSDDFLDSGDIVSTRGRLPQDTQRFAARTGDIADGKPIVVLINEGTASASEIVAGALQDNKRAVVIGETSYGKGSVQSIIPLAGPRGGALRLTTSKYYTPSGRSIQATGIVPDIAVSNRTEKDEAEAGKPYYRNEASLAGHFDAETSQRGVKIPAIRPEEGRKYDDFQLSYALNRLQGKSADVRPSGKASASVSD